MTVKAELHLSSIRAGDQVPIDELVAFMRARLQTEVPGGKEVFAAVIIGYHVPGVGPGSMGAVGCPQPTANEPGREAIVRELRSFVGDSIEERAAEIIANLGRSIA